MNELSEPSVSLSSLEQVLEMTKCKDGLSVKKKNQQNTKPLCLQLCSHKGPHNTADLKDMG